MKVDMSLTLEIISRVDHWRFRLEYRAQKITAAALALHWCCCYRWIFAVVERRDYLLHRPSEGEEEDGRFVCQCLKELPSISILKICRFVPCPVFSLRRKLLLLLPLVLLRWCQLKKCTSIFKNRKRSRGDQRWLFFVLFCFSCTSPNLASIPVLTSCLDFIWSKNESQFEIHSLFYFHTQRKWGW